MAFVLALLAVYQGRKGLALIPWWGLLLVFKFCFTLLEGEGIPRTEE